MVDIEDKLKSKRA